MGGDLLLDVLVMTLQTMVTVELVAEWQEMALAAVEGEWQEGTKDDDDGDGSGSGGRRGPKGEAAPANGIHVSSLPRRTDCSVLSMMVMMSIFQCIGGDHHHDYDDRLQRSYNTRVSS